MAIAYIALGSNLGNKQKNIDKALSLIKKKCEILSQSSWYKTEPIGFKDQDWFINGVIKVRTNFTPLELFNFTQLVEKKMKRIKTIKNGPRIIDLDILFYDHIILKLQNLIIPHPRLHERLFVLQPLSEISPNFVHPVFKKTILELLTMCHQ